MSAHTPGPWMLSMFNGNVYVCTPGSDGAYIAQVHGWRSEPTSGWDEADANAALIAAAPELADALRELLAYCEAMDPSGWSSSQEQARAALAKADR